MQRHSLVAKTSGILYFRPTVYALSLIIDLTRRSK